MSDKSQDDQVLETPDQAVNAVEETTTPSPSETETPSDAEVTESPESTEEGQEERVQEGTEQSEQSDRAQSRQHQLAQRLKEKDEELRQLRSQLGLDGEQDSPNQSAGSTGFDDNDGLPWLSNQQADDQPREISIEDYKRDVTSTADRIVKMRLQEMERNQKQVEYFTKEVDYLETAYPELRKGGDQYDPELSKKVIAVVQKARANNPKLSVREIVEPIMDLRRSGETVGRSTASASIARQQSEEAVTPGGGSSRKVSSEDQLMEMLKTGKITAKEAEELLPH